MGNQGMSDACILVGTVGMVIRQLNRRQIIRRNGGNRRTEEVFLASSMAAIGDFWKAGEKTKTKARASKQSAGEPGRDLEWDASLFFAGTSTYNRVREFLERRRPS